VLCSAKPKYYKSASFPVESIEDVRRQILALGATPKETTVQVDEYLNDPLRDFAKMDLALRIRRSDDQYFVTFKGPNLDPAAKIRTEIETPMVDRVAANMIRDTFLGIGFFSVASVKKKRETLELEWQGHRVEVCLDAVAEVGEFVEIELVVGSRSEMDAAKTALESLAENLGLTDSIRTSYLELLLRQRGDI
jgi:adenylate cyclase class 2